MARLNIYLPDEVAAGVRAARLNLSMVARVAALQELARANTRGWFQRVAIERGQGGKVPHEVLLGALPTVDVDPGA